VFSIVEKCTPIDCGGIFYEATSTCGYIASNIRLRAKYELGRTGREGIMA
jgi:hypothetical protein